MKRNLYLLLCLFTTVLLSGTLKAQKQTLIIGTYTRNTTSQGVYVYDFDNSSGKPTQRTLIKGVTDPSYLCISQDKRFIYTVNSSTNRISAFSFNSGNGSMRLINQQPAHGENPCYISIDKSRRFAFVANYGSGSLSVYPIKSNGALAEAVQVIQHIGKGPDAKRQEKPHVHSTILSPDEKTLYVSDLGTDQVYAYPFNPGNKEQPLNIADAIEISTPPGGGPRHLAVSANGQYIYSLQEMSGNISVIKKNENGFQIVQNISMLEEGWSGQTGAADIHLSPDGRYLYSSNRGDANDIAVFSVNPATGLLIRKANFSTIGKGPRNFAISPQGNFILAGNQYTNTVSIFKRDKQTGLLSSTGERIRLASPVCLKFVY